MSVTGTGTQFPLLTDGNFSNWLFRVNCLLDEKGCKMVTLTRKTETELNAMEVKQREHHDLLDARAKSVIVQCITDRHIEYVKDAKTSFDMIQSLKGIFERKSTLSKLYIRRQLLSLKCCGDSLQDHFMKFDGLIRDLESTGVKMDEDDKVCHLLLSVSEKYETIITVLETSSVVLTVDFVKSKLLDAELKQKNQEEKKNDNRESTFMSGEKPKCFNCGSEDHFIAKCPKPRKNSRGRFRGRGKGGFTRGRSKTNSSNVAQNETMPIENEISFVAIANLSTKVEEKVDNLEEFILDSGATQHLMRENLRKYMSNIMKISPINIKIANESTMIAKEKGCLRVKAKTVNGEVTINIEALIVKGLYRNLLSVIKINKAGIKVIFEKEVATMKVHDKIIKFPSENGLFMTKFMVTNNISRGTTALVSEKSNPNLWHQRLGHINRKGLQLLGLPFSEEVCGTCKEGKATRLPFKEATRPRSRRIGELIYTDVWGPTNIATKDNERYYITVIDDFSHFCRVYLMKSKLEAENVLIKFVNEMKAMNINISKLRSDNGGEFSSRKLKAFCEENGIKQEFTCSYTPQQNSVAERMNRTILDKVRCMFIDTKLPKYLWGEAVRSAVYQINRSPTKALNGEIPAMKYYGRLDLNKLRIFGAKVWVLKLPREGKLEPRALEMRMIGYSGAGYRLWNPKNDEIVISRDVTFDENNFKYVPECHEQINVENEGEKDEEYEERNSNEEMELDANQDEKDKGENEIEENGVQQTRSGRILKKPEYLNDYEIHTAYCLLTSDEEPTSYSEAVEDNDWKLAIENELNSLKQFNTYSVVKKPDNKRLIETKWVFKRKHDGIKKARLVAKGYQENIVNDVYAPVAKMATIRMLLAHALHHKYKVHQLDIPSAFLNGCLNSEIYLKIPEGFKIDDKNYAWKLNKAIYGLRESPKCWNETFNRFTQDNNLKRSGYDVCLYYNNKVWMVVFVDDIIITGEEKSVKEIFKNLTKEFNAKYLGEIKTFLGSDIEMREGKIKISQEKLIDKIINKFNMKDSKPFKTPMEVGYQVNKKDVIINAPYRELIGCLNYLAGISRPDISFATSFLGRFLDKPTVSVWKAAKRVLKYIKNTKSLCLTFERHEANEKLEAFSDSDWGTDSTDRKSVSGMAIYYHGNLVSWSSKKQQTVALSTAESEYVAATMCCTEILYLRGLAKDFGNKVCEPVLYVDNQSAVAMIKNHENTRRSKHIDIKVHFIKDVIANKQVEVKYVPTDKNIADVLTKSLCSDKFINFRAKLKLL